LPNLIEEVNHSHEAMSINKLCQYTDSEVSFLFKSCREVEPILEHFDCLFREYPNKFIQCFLECALQHSTNLSIKTFVPIIWEPIYAKCVLLITSLQDKSIKLVEVCNIYKEYVGTKGDVKDQLFLLHSALESCQGRIPKSNPEQWMEDVVYHMDNYLTLRKQSSAANLLLELKDKLHLSGDFTVVDTVAKQFIDSSHNEPLHSISSSLLSAVPFFHVLSANVKKYHCIEAYCECADIVKWIQKETKGMNYFYRVRVFYNLTKLVFF